MLNRLDIDAASERGFTLIELMITIAILLTVFGIISAAVLGAMTSTSQVTGSSRLQTRTNDFIATITNDIRSSSGEDRSSSNVNRDVLRTQIARRPAFSGKSGELDFREIIYADSESLILRTDAIDIENEEAALECVWYHRSASDALVRTVFKSSAPCPSNVSTDVNYEQTMLPSILTTPAEPLFKYTLAYNIPVMNGQLQDLKDCVKVSGQSIPNAQLESATTGIKIDADERQFYTIVGVKIHAVAIDQTAGSKATADTSIMLPSRGTPDYQFALGCAY